MQDQVRTQKLGTFRGYDNAALVAEDEELTHVGPGTPCGEYLRRFWLPIALVSQIHDVPLPISVLGEDLVVFRDLGGRLGILHRHCAHRRASLEYGIIAERGLRCCYHGWLFDVDGTVLETPGEPPGSTLKDDICQGAYPAHEYKGVVFGYFGPAECTPPFPDYDVFHEGEQIPFSLDIPCNWLQIRENAIDPYHTPFLHSRVSGVQFQDTWAELPVVDYVDRPEGFFVTNARRIGGNVWVRFHDIIDPTFSQPGGFSETGTKSKYFGRGGVTKWVLPVDNTHSKVIGFRYFHPRGDSISPTSREELGVNKVDHLGQTPTVPYEQAQKHPSDYEAWVGQGPINVHKKEYLGTTDRGVVLLRKRLRKDIRALRAGNLIAVPGGGTLPIPTYAGDTVLRVPVAPNGDQDRKLLADVSRRVADAYLKASHIAGSERYALVEKELVAIEKILNA